jgi:hypothetical protein
LIVYLADGPRDDIRDREAYNCANRCRQLASGSAKTGFDVLPHPS